MPGGDQRTRFLNRIVNRLAPEGRPQRGDDAVSAMRVAPVLDLQKRPLPRCLAAAEHWEGCGAHGSGEVQSAGCKAHSEKPDAPAHGEGDGWNSLCTRIPLCTRPPHFTNFSLTTPGDFGSISLVRWPTGSMPRPAIRHPSTMFPMTAAEPVSCDDQIECIGRNRRFLASPECKEAVEFQSNIVLVSENGVHAREGGCIGGVAGGPASGDNHALRTGGAGSPMPSMPDIATTVKTAGAGIIHA